MAQPVADADVLPGAERATLRAAAETGARWMLAIKPLTEVTAFVSTIFLARLLSPAETGPAAASLIVLAVGDILLYQGFGTHLIRRPEATWTEARTVLSLTLLTALAGVALVAGVFELAPVRATFGDEECRIIQLASLGLLLSAPNVTPQAVLTRQLAFKTIELRSAAAIVLGTVVAIVCAAAGVGGVSIVIGLLAQRALNSAMTQFLVRTIRPGWDRRTARDVIAFGGLTSLAGVFNQARRNVDYLILGAVLSPAAVGLYYRAYVLGAEYQQRLNVVITRLALPVFSRAEGLQDMWRLRRRIMRVQMSLIVPILAIFVAVAALVIPAVYGARWAPAAYPAQILTLVAAIGLIWNGTGPLLTAAGRPGVLAASNAFLLVTYAVTVLFAARLGLVALCWIIVASTLATTLVTTWWMVDRVLGFSVVPVLQELAVPLVCAAPTAALAFLIPRLSAPSVATSAVWIVVAAAWLALTYGLLMRVLAPDTFADLAGTAKRFAGPLRRRLRVR